VKGRTAHKICIFLMIKHDFISFFIFEICTKKSAVVHGMVGCLRRMRKNGLPSSYLFDRIYLYFSSIKINLLEENPKYKEERERASAELKVCKEALQIIGKFLFRQ
jgi:hypothetical protein